MSQEQHNNALMLQLKKHFKLTAEPFSSELAFFFEGAQRKHNLETLRHLATFGDLVLFVTGEKGSGKTCLLKQLEVESSDIVRVVYLECDRALLDSQGQQAVLIQHCLRVLALPNKDEPFDESCLRLLRTCDDYFELHGQRTLFVFDNADKLPKQQLLALCGFCRRLPEDSSLVMLFAGSSALLQSSKLGANLEQDAWWHQIQMKPFSRDEIQGYLQQALNAAGYQGTLELNDQQLNQLAQIGKGLPGRINKIFPSVILEPGLLKIPILKKTRNTTFRVMFGLAALLVLSFLFVSFQHGVFDRLIPVFSLTPIDKPGEPAMPEKIETAEPAENVRQLARLALLDAELKKQGLALPHEDAEPAMAEQQNTAMNEENGLPEKSKGELSENALTGSVEQPAPDTGAEQEKEKAAGVGQQDTVNPEEAVSDVAKSSDAATPLVEGKVERHKAFRSKQWLEKQPKKAYIPQILGSYEEQTAQKFIQELGVQKFEIFYLETEHKGRPWFVVFYGVFPSKAHAQDAIKNAPKRIKSQNPWLRSVDGVLGSYP